MSESKKPAWRRKRVAEKVNEEGCIFSQGKIFFLRNGVVSMPVSVIYA